MHPLGSRIVAASILPTGVNHLLEAESGLVLTGPLKRLQGKHAIQLQCTHLLFKMISLLN